MRKILKSEDQLRLFSSNTRFCPRVCTERSLWKRCLLACFYSFKCGPFIRLLALQNLVLTTRCLYPTSRWWNSFHFKASANKIVNICPCVCRSRSHEVSASPGCYCLAFSVFQIFLRWSTKKLLIVSMATRRIAALETLKIL